MVQLPTTHTVKQVATHLSPPNLDGLVQRWPATIRHGVDQRWHALAWLHAVVDHERGLELEVLALGDG